MLNFSSMLFKTFFLLFWATRYSFGHLVIRCGGNLIATTEVQQLRSPNYPDNYYNKLNCSWLIAPGVEDAQIEIEVLRFDTEACCDSLTLKDGLTPRAEKIANIRGNFTGGKYATAFGSLQVLFESDESITGSGFVLSYRIADVGQPSYENLEASNISSLIVSPNWPQSYPPNLMYSWVVQAESNYHACLTVLYLKTEECCDSLVIRNGNTETSPLLGDLRGERKGLLFTSSRGGALSLRFFSDATNNDWGFLLSYFSWTEDVFEDPRHLHAKATECQEKVINITDGYGTITPPGFPGTYPSNLQCSWIINAPIDCRVRIWFSYVNTETCCDWIKVRDGKKHSDSKVGIVSGDTNSFQNYVSNNHSLRLEFDTDSATNFRGFVAYYEVVKENNSLSSHCGGTISASLMMTYITSPNWPQVYRSEINECIWHVTTEPSRKIRLIVLGFLSQQEQYELVVFDGPSIESDIIFDLNNNIYQPLVVSSSNSSITLSYLIPSIPSVEYGAFRAAVISYQDN